LVHGQLVECSGVGSGSSEGCSGLVQGHMNCSGLVQVQLSVQGCSVLVQGQLSVQGWFRVK